MTVFGMSDRGKFRSITVDTSDGQGVQVTIPGATAPVGSASLVTSFSAEQHENFSISQCLNGGLFLYTFGHAPQNSIFSLGVTSFLNTCSGTKGADFATALKSYQAGRVSKSKALSSLSVGNAVLRGYLTGQSVAVGDNALSMITVNYTFVALSPQMEQT